MSFYILIVTILILFCFDTIVFDYRKNIVKSKPMNKLNSSKITKSSKDYSANPLRRTVKSLMNQILFMMLKSNWMELIPSRMMMSLINMINRGKIHLDRLSFS